MRLILHKNHQPPHQRVHGSSPCAPTNKIKDFVFPIEVAKGFGDQMVTTPSGDLALGFVLSNDVHRGRGTKPNVALAESIRTRIADDAISPRGDAVLPDFRAALC
jgi:hypothetical protein